MKLKFAFFCIVTDNRHYSDWTVIPRTLLQSAKQEMQIIIIIIIIMNR